MQKQTKEIEISIKSEKNARTKQDSSQKMLREKKIIINFNCRVSTQNTQNSIRLFAHAIGFPFFFLSKYILRWYHFEGHFDDLMTMLFDERTNLKLTTALSSPVQVYGLGQL